MVLTIVTDWILIRGVFFCVLIQIVNKIGSFQNEEHTFVHQKS